MLDSIGLRRFKADGTVWGALLGDDAASIGTNDMQRALDSELCRWRSPRIHSFSGKVGNSAKLVKVSCMYFHLYTSVAVLHTAIESPL